MSNQPSKRQRLPVSCLQCRKRKVKCDRRKPHCSSCIKNKSESSCVYENPIWIHSKSEENSKPVRFFEPFEKKVIPPLPYPSGVRSAGSSPGNTVSPPRIPSVNGVLGSSGALGSNGSQIQMGTLDSSPRLDESMDSLSTPSNLEDVVTAGQNQQESNQSLIHSEIDQLKDRLNRLQASLYITELSNSGGASDKGSPNPMFASKSPERRESRVARNINEPQIETVYSEKKQVSRQERHERFDSEGSVWKQTGNLFDSAPTVNDPAEMNLDANFYDTFMRTIQKTDFLNFLENNDSSVHEMFSVPVSLSNKFSAQELDAVINLRNNEPLTKSAGFSDFNFVSDSGNDLACSLSFNLIWFAFENDFYIKSSLILACLDMYQSVQHLQKLVLQHPELQNRFLTTEKDNNHIQDGKQPLLAMLSNIDLRIIKNCIMTSMNLKRHIVEPIIIDKDPFMTFDLANNQLIDYSCSRATIMRKQYVKYLFTEIQKNFPNRKTLFLLMTGFINSLLPLFPYLSKDGILVSYSQLDEILFEAVVDDTIFDKMCMGSIIYTLDSIGVLLMCLKTGYSMTIDKIREKVYENNFDESKLDSSEKYLLELGNIDCNKYVTLAKLCFSYKFKFDNLYHDFPRVEFALKKIQLGILLVYNSLFFEDQMRHDGFSIPEEGAKNSMCIGSSVLRQQENCVSSAQSIISGPDFESDDFSGSKMLAKDFLRSLYCHTSNSVATNPEVNASSKQGIPTADGRNGNFSFNTGNFLLVVQNLGWETYRTFSQLFDFASAFKIDKDPMSFIDLNLAAARTANIDNKDGESLRSTLEIVRSWRLTWFELVSLDSIFSMTTGRASRTTDDQYEESVSHVLYSGSDYAIDSPEEKVSMKMISKRRLVKKIVIDPLSRFIKNSETKKGNVKLKDYLVLVKAIDNFIEFKNDYTIPEIFEFIDGFAKKYPLYFLNPQSLNEEDRKQHHDIHRRSTTKSFEVIAALTFYISTIGTEFSVFYSLFSHLDKAICFDRSNNDVPIFKKVFINTETIIIEVLGIFRKILSTREYRIFFCGNYKFLFRKKSEPLLLSFFVHQLGIIIRLDHTIRLLQDYLKHNRSTVGPVDLSKSMAETTKKIEMTKTLLAKTKASVAEISELFKSINNYTKEPEESDLSTEQIKLYELINQRSIKTSSLFSSEVISMMMCQSAMICSLKLKSVDDMLDTDSSNDLLHISTVKFRKFNTANGESLVLPNFNSFLYFDTNELAYIANDLMSDFKGEGMEEGFPTPDSLKT